YLNNPSWDDLEDILGEAIRRCPPVFFYLDGIYDEFSYAPMYWLECQKGLFYQVMRLLRDPKLGGRLHIVVSIRDVVMSSVLKSEHAPKFIGEPHIRLLTWDREALGVLLEHKLESLDPSCFVGELSDGRSIATWLGRTHIQNEARNVTENVEDYILRHTRLIPRDLVSIGNAICTETRKRRVAGEKQIAESRLREIVANSARRFGDSQLAQCSNQIASDMMPDDAARHQYTQVYTGPQAYLKHISDDLRTIIQAVGVDRFGKSELSTLRALANQQWDDTTDLAAVLWQNGLLGCVERSGRSTFYSLGGADQFTVPDGPDTFVFHPCVIDSVGIKSADGAPVVPF
ncbi:MAG TPA: hypothetical protein VHN36_00005, partial [Ilumatobacteraceae bacterium]|nr:hypothetical protein [Ilumatobacteraceae bacterium]